MREAPPGKFGEVVTEHRNTEGELATIETVAAGPFAGKKVLCLYDDHTPVVAPMLLDDGTESWLRRYLENRS